MKKSTYNLFTAVIILFFLLFNVTLVHTKPGAPPSGGVSGDPSRSTCAFIGCHPTPELAFNPGELDFNMGITSGNLTSIVGQTYVPGQTYFMQFQPNVTNGSNTKYGFQMTSLDSAANMAGAFTITDATRNSAQSLLSRNYIGHKNANSSNVWNFKWTAPATNTGKITFYYAVDDANGNGNESGDKIYKGTVDLLPFTATGINEAVESVSSLQFFPNPFKETFFVSLNMKYENPVQINLLSTDGRIIETQSENHLHKGENTIQINLTNATPSGVYLLQVISSNQRITRQMVRM